MYESKRQYQYGTGRRKSSIARVRLYQGGTGCSHNSINQYGLWV